MAPMVHWPEAMMTYDEADKILFSADAFGTFKALNGSIFNDEIDFDRDWLDEARRYYTNIVGKYGMQVQSVLKKASGLDIRMICPLHGPIWRTDLDYIIEKYDKWSRYEPEVKGVMIAYASMYGNTENMADILAVKLAEKGVKDIRMHNISKNPCVRADRRQLQVQPYRTCSAHIQQRHLSSDGQLSRRYAGACS